MEEKQNGNFIFGGRNMADYLDTEKTRYLLSEECGECFICKKATNRIEIYCERFFCSEECMEKFYKKYVEPQESYECK